MRDSGEKAAEEWPKFMDTETSAKYLSEVHKTGTKTSTLATKRRTGGGPPYSRPDGIRPRYERRDLDAWVSANLAKKFTRTCEERRGDHAAA
jgi:hypothetical protein